MPERGALKRRADECRRKAAVARYDVARHLWLSAAGHLEAAGEHVERAARSEQAAARYEGDHGAHADADQR